MATNITSMVDGIVMIQIGFGVPTHYSPFGSEYTDLDTQIKYHNKTTKNNWVRFLDESDADIIISGSTFTGGTVSGDTIFLSGVTANTITANTYYGLPTTNNGGGQIYYMNLSETQNPNDIPTPIVGYNLLNTDFKTINTSKSGLVPPGKEVFANFITKFSYPNSPIIPAGLWSFYLNITKVVSSDIEVSCEVYSIDLDNNEIMLFETEFKKITSDVPILTSKNIRLDKYFDGCTINKEDRILVKIFTLNNDMIDSKMVTLNSDGDKYSYLVSSLHLSIDSIVLDGGEY